MTICTAPGKALLVGEYAVLAGGPAISMAVDRRAVAEVASSTSAVNELAVHGYLDGRWSFLSRDDRRIEWLEPAPAAGSFGLFECLWRHTDLDIERNWAVTLDTRAFFDPDSGRKLGLGSSAALSVAAAGVMAGPGKSASSAGDAHREFQGGSGSGVDVATSVTGGVVYFRRDADPGQVDWPEGLGFRLLWSGASADTASRIGRFSGGNGADAAGLIAAAERAASAWVDGDPGNVLESTAAYTSALRRFDLDRELGIFEAGHLELAEAAPGKGVVYKPCGAGGGDIGIALSDDVSALDAFTGFARTGGFRRLDLAIDAKGLARTGPNVDD